MRISHGLAGLTALPAAGVMSIGNFDGVHRGHQEILAAARNIADQSGGSRAPVCIVTFEPHPMTVLRPDRAPPRLTPPAIKEPLLAAAGVDELVILPPDAGTLGLSAEEFWLILRDQVRPAHLIEGASFRFGKGAAGTVPLLQTWAASSSIKLHVAESVQIPLLDLHIVPVSSTLIRFCLGTGRVREAAILLGRPYKLRGRVVHGAGRGRTIGTPTANLQCDEQMIPDDAVYAGRCSVDGRDYPAAVSIGPAPTFDDPNRRVEIHLIGFSGDLYGQTLEVSLIDWLRERRAFAGAAALVEQIRRDIAGAEELAHRDPAVPIAAI